MSAAIRWPRWPDKATRSGCWPGRVSGSRRPLTRWGAAGADAVVGDVSSAAAVEHAMVGCDAVVHVASVVSFDPRRAAAMQQANPAGTGTVLEAAQRHGLDPIV
jgi:dihydroflavonol-4-reductase